MARGRAFQDVRSDAYKRADAENQTALIPTTEAGDYINQGYAWLYRLMARAGRLTYFPKKSILTTTNGTSQYAFSSNAAVWSVDTSDFFLDAAVHANVDGHKVPLEQFSFDELAVLSDTSVGWTGRALKYRVIENNIHLLPAPTTGVTVDLWYVPAPRRFATNGAHDLVEIDGVADYEDALIDYAAAKMAVKRKNWELANYLEGQVAKKQQELEALAGQRMSGPGMIVDVTAKTDIRTERSFRRRRVI